MFTVSYSYKIVDKNSNFYNVLQEQKVKFNTFNEALVFSKTIKSNTDEYTEVVGTPVLEAS